MSSYGNMVFQIDKDASEGGLAYTFKDSTDTIATLEEDGHLSIDGNLTIG